MGHAGLIEGSSFAEQELRQQAANLFLEHGVNAKHWVAEQLDRAMEADDHESYAAWVCISLLLLEMSVRPIQLVRP